MIQLVYVTLRCHEIYITDGRRPEDSVNPVRTKLSGVTNLYHGCKL